MAVNISKFAQPQMYNYQYDQLNRLVGMDTYRGLNQAANNWSSLAMDSAYFERITYDPNGNIQKYLRYGKTGTLKMDSLTYNYTAGSNRLDYVRDRNLGSTSYASNYSEDIDDQSAGNYAYDSIGNLIYDRAEKLDSIRWNEYGKITEIFKRTTTNTTSTYVHYYYDPSGNRIEKAVEKYPGPHQYDTYVRDAQGNVLAVYEVNALGASNGPAYLIEQHMYGSSRLGLINRSQNVDSLKINPVNANLIGATYLTNFTRGNELFELTNHLGNVLVTVSDKKYGKDITGDGQYDFYTADSISNVDYTPFGMEMVNRYSSPGSFRYGFNNKEKDNEDYGEGNSYDYGNRIYNPRIGRFLSIDPLQKKYPGESPYLFTGGNPVYFLDPEGKDRITTHVYINQNTGEKTIIKITEYGEIKSKPIQVRNTIDKSDWHWEYEWHDVEQTVTHVQKDGKDLAVFTGQETLGKYKTTTDLNLKIFAQWKTAVNQNSWGGIEFYSENGQGQETKRGSGSIEREEISTLLAAASASNAAGKAEQMLTKIQKVLEASSKLEKAKELLEVIKFTNDLSKKLGDVGKIQIQTAEKSMANPNNTIYQKYCVSCNITYVKIGNDTIGIMPGSTKLKTIKGKVDTIDASSTQHPNGSIQIAH